MKKIPINGGYGHVGQKIARRLVTVGCQPVIVNKARKL